MSLRMLKARKAVPATGRPTCPRLPAPKACKGRTLNPETGPAQTGEATRVCATVRLRQFGSNLEDPTAAAMPSRGAGFKTSSCPGSLHVNFKQEGW
jgi:hypothetical protein